MTAQTCDSQVLNAYASADCPQVMQWQSH